MMNLPTRTAVAAALAEAGETGLSGEALAASLGISRAAVNRHMATLRELGYDISSAPRAGYRLRSAPDTCIPEEVAPRLRDDLWRRCEGSAEMASTNDEAKRLARQGAEEGTLVLAGRQTHGRGRFGREWTSPAGGVYASFVLRPTGSPTEVAPLPLVVALGAARALDTVGLTVDLKWPNDLEVGSRKLGGILLEMAAEADRVEWVVVGIGVNVADPHAAGTAWVRESAPTAAVADLAAAVLDGIAGAYREFVMRGFAIQRSAYEARLQSRGAEVAVRNLGGDVAAEGVLRGVADNGALLLERDGQISAVHAGEVTMREARRSP